MFKGGQEINTDNENVQRICGFYNSHSEHMQSNYLENHLKPKCEDIVSNYIEYGFWALTEEDLAFLEEYIYLKSYNLNEFSEMINNYSKSSLGNLLTSPKPQQINEYFHSDTTSRSTLYDYLFNADKNIKVYKKIKESFKEMLYELLENYESSDIPKIPQERVGAIFGTFFMAPVVALSTLLVLPGNVAAAAMLTYTLGVPTYVYHPIKSFKRNRKIDQLAEKMLDSIFDIRKPE